MWGRGCGGGGEMAPWSLASGTGWRGRRDGVNCVMSTLTLHVVRMEGVTDAAHIEKSLEAVPKVRAVEVDPGGERVVVDHDGADPERLMTALKHLGYDCEEV